MVLGQLGPPAALLTLLHRRILARGDYSCHGYCAPHFAWHNKSMNRLKREKRAAALGLHYWTYNYARRHRAHKMTPAQALGVESDPLTLGDLLDLAEAN